LDSETSGFFSSSGFLLAIENDDAKPEGFGITFCYGFMANDPKDDVPGVYIFYSDYFFMYRLKLSLIKGYKSFII